jgi:hypothetical protein
MKNKSKQTKPLVADKSPEKLKRLRALNDRVRGSFVKFMTQEDLKSMREGAKAPLGAKSF